MKKQNDRHLKLKTAHREEQSSPEVQMDEDPLFPDSIVFGDDVDQCPECSHIWTDEAECHYHDCRYFVLDQEMELYEDEIEEELPWGRSTRKKPAA